MKKQLSYPGIHIFYYLIFNFDFQDFDQIYTNVIQVFTLFMKAIFPGSDTHPIQVDDMDPWPAT